MPRIPISPSLRRISAGNSSRFSRSTTPGAISDSAKSPTAAAPSLLPPRLRSVRPALLHVPERHDDLGAPGARPQKGNEAGPQRRGGIGIRGQGRKPLGVEENHAGPADGLAPSVRRLED